MTKLTSYTCAKCGGVLNVDIGQAVFDCPFCGNGFDLSDFHRGEVLNEAALNLKNREFQSARNAYSELQKMEESLVTEPGKADHKEQNQVAFSVPELTDKVICSGCGGYLYADKKKNLLMCRSCGVAYGTSLFFGNIKMRALEALNACEYIEADQRYLHALMRASLNLLQGRASG